MIDEAFARFNRAEEIAGDDTGTIAIQGERFNIMGAEYFMADIFHTLTEVYGPGAGGILRETGETYGTDLLAFVSDHDDPQNLFGRFLGLLKFLGYSTPTVTGTSISFPSAPTAAAYRETDHDPRQTCYFLEGMLTGALNDLFDDDDLQVTEETCIADGDDVCRFTIKNRDGTDQDPAP
jgi:predicted hydrocarbon binding protein